MKTTLQSAWYLFPRTHFHIRPILICVSYKEGKGWDGGREEGRKTKNAYQTTLMCSCALEGGGRRRRRERGRPAGGAGQRKEEQMHCGGRGGGGGGPTAIVHVLLWTKGSSGSVCKPTAGFSPLTRPHAGQNITDRLPQFRRYSLSVSRFEEIFFSPLILVRGTYCVGTSRPAGLSVFTHGAYTRSIITDL